MTLNVVMIVMNLLFMHTLALPMDRTTGNPSTSGRYFKKLDKGTINRQAFQYVEHAYKQVQELNGHNRQLCSTELSEASKLCNDQSGQHSPKGFHRKSYGQASNTLLHFAIEKHPTEEKDHVHHCKNCKKTMARNEKRKEQQQQQQQQLAITDKPHNIVSS